MSSSPVLSVERLAKSFGTLKAVDGVSFHVSPGEIVGLLGPNGAGNTRGAVQWNTGRISRSTVLIERKARSTWAKAL